MHSLMVIRSRLAHSEQNRLLASEAASAEKLLIQSGYQVTAATSLEEAKRKLADADASILVIPISDYSDWRKELLSSKSVPALWWCSEITSDLSAAACEDDFTADGILSSSMLPAEIHWALHFSARQFFAEQQWKKEREQLLSRLEERKWIDMAKGILSRTRNISESEAYEYLRKEAMNERKRLVDVATSIVKAYQLLHKP
ncbi:histidine kinase [Paenibacillus yonginensis]|uniref:Histidine kinase n=1 Tax=Paenibacillus yonginensis TaxID=1462996 RepID=A0A1B1MWP9_9BACL|nr:ANTAR domain-containing protein [Paenibacillus yonginensis]ANS73585.1 histidine kinase [Paenibacillus yonginensis]